MVLLITRSTSDHKLEEKKFQAQFEVRATTLDATRRGAFALKMIIGPKICHLWDFKQIFGAILRSPGFTTTNDDVAHLLFFNPDSWP